MRPEKPFSIYAGFCKRVIDFIISFMGLIVISPILLLITIILAIVYRGKPFFIQARPGLNEKIFRLYKFRTMRDLYDKDGNLLPDKERITLVGHMVRALSLDELLQLVNVLKGDMSLVGPRPLLVKYLPLYNETQRRRHLVRPGITGWAQVNGRNAISWQQKFEYDVWYVENISLWLDVKILWLTLIKVIRSEGINAAQTATMESFKGNLN